MIGIKSKPKFDAQELMNLVKANETAKDFNLSSWLQPCGTFGCLVGNHMVANGVSVKVDFLSRVPVGYDKKRYGLSQQEFDFLFASCDIFREFCITYNAFTNQSECFTSIMVSKRNYFDKEAALNRVRKLIWWKLRKQEIMADDNARHIEGDWDLVNEVKQKIKNNNQLVEVEYA